MFKVTPKLSIHWHNLLILQLRLPLGVYHVYIVITGMWLNQPTSLELTRCIWNNSERGLANLAPKIATEKRQRNDRETTDRNRNNVLRVHRIPLQRGCCAIESSAKLLSQPCLCDSQLERPSCARRHDGDPAPGLLYGVRKDAYLTSFLLLFCCTRIANLAVVRLECYVWCWLDIGSLTGSSCRCVYMYLYEIDFLGPLELSLSGCHHFYEGAQWSVMCTLSYSPLFILCK